MNNMFYVFYEKSDSRVGKRTQNGKFSTRSQKVSVMFCFEVSFLILKSRSVFLLCFQRDCLFYFSQEALLSRRVISETEEAIRSRLKPLLDRAEVRKSFSENYSTNCSWFLNTFSSLSLNVCLLT